MLQTVEGGGFSYLTDKVAEAIKIGPLVGEKLRKAFYKTLTATGKRIVAALQGYDFVCFCIKL